MRTSILVAVFVLFRLATAFLIPADKFPNTTPIMGLALVGGIMLPRWQGIWLPALIMIISDLIIGTQYGFDWLGRATVYMAVFTVSFWGLQFRNRRSAWVPMGQTLLCTLGFYLVTNTQTFLFYPDYARTWWGYLQCLTVGLPQYRPTWTFLANSIIADQLFVIGVLVIYNWRVSSFHYPPFRWKNHYAF